MVIHSLDFADRTAIEIGLLTPHNPFDRRSFSGTAFFATRALAARPDIKLRILGGHRPPGAWDRLLRRKPPAIDVDTSDVAGLDAVVGLVATPLLARLMDRCPDLPVLHVTDSTPAFLRTSYGWRLPTGAGRAETRVAAGATRVVYSSDKIAERAPADLGLPDLKADVVPFGVNIEALPETCPKKPALDRINLLFVGIDWVRKGGDVAVAVLDRLNAMGIDAHLTIVGRCPERHNRHPRITNFGFLDKNRPAEAARLSRLYAEAHFVLLPSRADCSPMVIGEAMVHGTPVLATDTGGIASQIGGESTGRLLPPIASPERWSREITRIIASPETYHFMSDASFERARYTLSWDNWAIGIERLARQASMSNRHSDLKTAIGA